MFSRSCLTVILALSLSGCFTISKASRDSDEEEWGAKWGSDDVKPAPGTDKKNQNQVADPMPPPTQPPPPRVQPDTVPPPPPPVIQPEPAPVVAEVKKKKKRRKRRPRRKRKNKRRKTPKPAEATPTPEPIPANPLPVEEPPEPGQPTPARAPEVLYPPDSSSEPDTIPLPPTGSALGHNPDSVAPTGPARPTGLPGKNPDPDPEPVPVAIPEPEPDPQSARVESKGAPQAGEPWVYIDAQGGIYITQKGKVQPATGVGVGVNLGKLVGWRGLYLGADVDIIIGQVPLGTADYVMLDSHFGFRGRFEVGPVKILAGLGFGLRNAFITGYTSSSEPATHLGFGLVASAGVEVPVWGPLSVVVEGDGRYIKDPFTSKFFFSSMVGGGVGLVF